MTQILIADRQPLFIRGLQEIIAEMGIESVVAEMNSLPELLDQIRHIQPDMALIDISFSLMSSIELAKNLREVNPAIRFIFLTSFEDETRMYIAIKAGASAYLTRYLSLDEYKEKITKVLAGEYMLLSEIIQDTQKLNNLAMFPSSKEVPLTAQTSKSPLSVREIEILDHIAQGHSNKEIASHLGISDQTVKNHITSILKKMDVNDRTAAVVHALRNGWIQLHAA